MYYGPLEREGSEVAETSQEWETFADNNRATETYAKVLTY